MSASGTRWSFDSTLPRLPSFHSVRAPPRSLREKSLSVICTASSPLGETSNFGTKWKGDLLISARSAAFGLCVVCRRPSRMRMRIFVTVDDHERARDLNVDPPSFKDLEQAAEDAESALERRARYRDVE